MHWRPERSETGRRPLQSIRVVCAKLLAVLSKHSQHSISRDQKGHHPTLSLQQTGARPLTRAMRPRPGRTAHCRALRSAVSTQPSEQRAHARPWPRPRPQGTGPHRAWLQHSELWQPKTVGPCWTHHQTRTLSFLPILLLSPAPAKWYQATEKTAQHLTRAEVLRGPCTEECLHGYVDSAQPGGAWIQGSPMQTQARTPVGPAPASAEMASRHTSRRNA